MAVFGDSTPNAALSQLPFTADDNEDWEAQQDLWPVVGLGTDVAEHFQAVAGTVASQPTPLPTAVTDTSVAGLISVAVHLDDPQLNFPYRPRRITGKQSVALDIGLFLGRLQRRPEADCNYPANHYQRKLGWHAYQRVLALTTEVAGSLHCFQECMGFHRCVAFAAVHQGAWSSVGPGSSTNRRLCQYTHSPERHS